MSTIGQQGTGFQPTGTSGGGVPLFPQASGTMAGRKPPTAQQLLMGGQAIPGQFMTPVGPAENAFAGAGAGGLPFASSVAAGQIPSAILQQYRDLQNQQNAQIIERMGGARFGSDLTGLLARSGGMNLTNLLADTQRNAVGTEMGFANPVLQAEQQRTQGGQQLAWQNFLQGQQLPAALSLLLSLAGLGGGTTLGGTSEHGWNLGGKL